MEGSRPYTFRIILLLGIFMFGFILARAIVLSKNNRLENRRFDSIQGKRFLSIKKAMEEGKREYEFEVGYNPIIDK